MNEPSTCMVPVLVGEDVTDICTVLVVVPVVVLDGAKVAVSVTGPFITTEAEGEVPLNEPEPEPVHETNVKPPPGIARIGITALPFW